MKRFRYCFVAVIICLILAACSDPDSGGELLSPEIPSMVKINNKGQRILVTSWCEKGVDPRSAMGYVLEDGTPLIDHVVQLYGLGLTSDQEDCSKVPERYYCDKKGMHFCVTDKPYLWERMFRDYNTTVKPIRDKGHKYLINIIPDHAPLGILYRWPMVTTNKPDNYWDPEERYSWEKLTGEKTYAYGKDAVAALLEQLQQIYKDGPFDGLAYDEEYGSGFRTGTINGESKELSGYPDNYPGVNENESWKISAGNLLRFAHEANVKIKGDRYIKRALPDGKFAYDVKPRRQADGSWDKELNGYDIFENEKFAPIPAKDWEAFKQDEWNDPVMRKAMQAEREQSKNRLIFESYEIRAGGKLNLTPSYTYPTDPNDPSYDERWPGLTINRNDLIDRTYNSSYGGYSPGGWAGNHRFGPMSIDLGFNELSPKPPPGESGGSGIIARTKEHFAGNYGVIMFYCLTSRAYIQSKNPNYFGPDKTPAEVYLSEMTKILFGQGVKYIESRDYEGGGAATGEI